MTFVSFAERDKTQQKNKYNNLEIVRNTKKKNQSGAAKSLRGKSTGMMSGLQAGGRQGTIIRKIRPMVSVRVCVQTLHEGSGDRT